MNARLASERGSGTLLVLAIITMTVVVGIVGLAIAELAAARSRAGSAADLSALAGASRHLYGDECAEAERVARRAHARMDECRTSAEDVVVVVSIDAPSLLRSFAGMAGQSAPRVTVEARGGPPL